MSSVLEQLYFGEIRPEEVIVPKSPEYRSLNEKISNLKEQLQLMLSEKEIELLDETFDLLGRSFSIYSTEVFVHGFKMGALMINEVLDNKG